MNCGRMTILILSCDKFSDLWDGNVQLFNQNWSDRGVRTCIVTDKETTKHYANVEIIAATDAAEWSERLAYALQQVDTDYVFVTLDDYFLIRQVSDRGITDLLDMMQKMSVSYLRLFPRPKRATRNAIEGYDKIYWVDTNENYSVNLYAGIWKKDFLAYTVKEPKNAWQFEVQLPRRAREFGAKCAVSYNHDFVILDVVRKGKLLHKAVRYFKKHDVYHGNREIQSLWYEVKLGIRTFGARHMPKFIVNLARSYMIKRGHHYFSEDA